MFRSIGKSKIAILLAILFGISLFFFRQQTTVSNIFNSDNVIAKVSGTPISTTKFNRTFQLNIQQFNQMLGKAMTNEEIKNLQIHSLALNALINDAIFENEFDNIGFEIDDKVIALKTKETIPELYDKNNKINDAYLNQFLNNQRLKIEDIVQIVDYETRNNFFNETLLDIKYPEEYSKIIELHKNHEREIDYINFPIDRINIESLIPNDNKILEKKLLDFYEKNTDKYMSEEERNIEYVLINKKDYNEKFIPTNYEVSEYYEKNIKLFFENEKRSFVQFNFKNKQEALKFKDEIKFLLNVQDVIEYAEGKNIQYNSFNELSYEDLLESIASKLFNLKINEQSNVIETEIASHIVVLKDLKEKNQLTLEQVKDDIIKNLTEIESQNHFDDLENKISQKIIEGDSLEKIAKEFNLGNLKIIKKLTKKFNDFESNEKKFYQSLIKNAFNTNEDFVSNIINIDNERFYLFNVSKINFELVKEYNDVYEMVKQDWKNFKRNELIIEKVEKNNDLNFIDILSNTYDAEKNNIKIQYNSSKLPQKLIEGIFKNGLNKFNLIIEKNEVFISKTNDIIFDKNYVSLTNNSISLLNDFRNNIGTELLKKVKISTNDRLLNSIINRYSNSDNL